MKLVKNFSQKHIIIFSIITVIIALSLLIIATPLRRWYSSDPELKVLISMLAYMLPIAFVLLVMKLIGVNNIFKKNGFIKGVLLGWYVIIDLVILFILSYPNANIMKIYLPSVSIVIESTIYMLIVGFFEESLFRGLIFNNMLKKWGSDKKGVFCALLLSSIIFGIIHSINLTLGEPLLGALVQIFNTTLMGIFFAAIYLRCKNMWAIILLHSFLDWINLLEQLLLPPALPLPSPIICMAIPLPYLFIGLFLLRKVPLETEPLPT